MTFVASFESGHEVQAFANDFARASPPFGDAHWFPWPVEQVFAAVHQFVNSRDQRHCVHTSLNRSR